MLKILKFEIIFFVCVVVCVSSLSQRCYSQDKILKDSLEIRLKNANSDSLKVEILVSLSKLYFSSNLVSSIEYLDKALDVIDTTHNTMQLARLYRAKGGILIYLGNYKEANTTILKALRVAKELNLAEEVLPVYSNLGVIHEELNQFDIALDYYLKALSEFNNIKDVDRSSIQSRLGALYDNLGSVYMKLHDYNSAEVYFKKVLELTDKSGELVLKIFGLRNLGDVYMANQDFRNAISYYNKSLTISLSINRADDISTCYIRLADYYLRIGNYDSALFNAQNAKHYASLQNSLKTKKNAADVLYKVQAFKGDYKKAFEVLLESKELGDSLLNESTIDKIAREQTRYEYENLVKLEKEEQERIKVKNTATIIVLILLIIVLALAFFLLRSKINRVKIERNAFEKEVELKNKELAVNVLYLVKKNEFINSVTEKLLELRKTSKSDNHEQIRKIIVELQANSDSEVWEEFELRFQQVHKEFYNNLQNKYPELTMADRKLAALLRLDMTTKEISSITGQSLKGVDVARSRLRKKLGINNQDVNLASFLLKI